MGVVLCLLGEGIRQPREPAHVHPHREVLALDVRRADVLRPQALGSLRNSDQQLARKAASVWPLLVGWYAHGARVAHIR
jgi:hypothetical protein